LELTVNSINIDFHQLVDNSLNTIWIVDLDNTILFCNKSGLELLNISPEDILNKDVCSFLPAALHNRWKKRLHRIITKGDILDPTDIKIMKNGGKMIDVEVISLPYYADGEIYAQVILRDITHRKIAEKLLSDREKLASVGQLAAGMIHEVKNPLTAVKGFLHLLKEQYSHVYLDTMESELNRALETLQNLLQVAKPDLQDEPFVPIDVSKELSSLLPLFQEKLYGLEVELQINDSGIIIMGKKNSFIKTFFNLIKNAIEAMDAPGKLKIEHYRQNDWLYINVSDTGSGIPEEKLNMLGTPFFTTKADGTGLGLTQVYATIHDHGGHILVDSIVGKGTTFHIRLPIQDDDSDISDIKMNK
jgi:two-component system sporulation sensor kinase A